MILPPEIAKEILKIICLEKVKKNFFFFFFIKDFHYLFIIY